MAAFDHSRKYESYPSWRGPWRTLFSALLLNTYRHVRALKSDSAVVLPHRYAPLHRLHLMFPFDAACCFSLKGSSKSLDYTPLCFGKRWADQISSNTDGVLQLSTPCATPGLKSFHYLSGIISKMPSHISDFFLPGNLLSNFLRLTTPKQGTDF